MTGADTSPVRTMPAADPFAGLTDADYGLGPVDGHGPDLDGADLWEGFDAAPANGRRPGRLDGDSALAVEARALMSAESDRAAGLDEDGADEVPEPLPGHPPFPIDRMTGPLRAFLDWGIKDGLHAECLAAAGLTALATLTGPARLELSPTRVTRGALWIALIGAPSAGKSPAYRHAFAGIREHHAARYADYEAEMKLAADAADAGQKVARPALPRAHELDDATIESVARWLKAGGTDPSGAIVDDELAAFLEGLGQYKTGRNADASKWLKLWTGAPIHIQRVGGGGDKNETSIYVPDPVVSLSGPLVPSRVNLLGSQGSGFRPRWLPFYSPADEPTQGDAGPYPDEWTGCIAALLANRRARTWELSDAARGAWESARQRWHDQQADPEPDDVTEALRKADDQCLRIALVLADASRPTGAGGKISVSVMRSAIAVVDYAISAWRALPGTSVMTTSRQEDVMESAYSRFAEWLRTRPRGAEGLAEGAAPRPCATRRELSRWLHEKPAKIDALIGEHRARWPGCVVTVKPAHGPARVYLYDPPRENRTVAATVQRGAYTGTGEGETAGGDSAGELSRPATVQSATVHPRQFSGPPTADGWGPGTVGSAANE